MKKIIIATMMVFLVAASVISAGISTSEAASRLKAGLKAAGFACDVEVSDADENGVMDFGIEYMSGGEGGEVIMLLAATTGEASAVISQTDFKVDKVFVLAEGTLYLTTASKCTMCGMVIANDDSTDKEVRECLESIWTAEEID